MLNLPLDPHECALLQEELGRALHGLRTELVHTTARDYRDGVRRRLEELERIEARLALIAPPAETAAAR